MQNFVQGWREKQEEKQIKGVSCAK